MSCLSWALSELCLITIQQCSDHWYFGPHSDTTVWLWGWHYDNATTTTRDTPEKASWWDLNTQIHWCSGYPQFIINNIKYRRQDFTRHSGYPQRSSWGAPTASDELYSCSGWRPWVEPKLIESGMGIGPRDWPNDVSLAWLIRSYAEQTLTLMQ